MTGLDRKRTRTLALLLKALFGGRSFEPETIEAARRLGPRYLEHEVRLHDGRSLLLTADGVATIQKIEKILIHVNLVDHVEKWDVLNAFHRVLARLLSKGESIVDAGEFVSVVVAETECMRGKYWYAAPVNGIEFSGIDRIRLGDMLLVKADEAELKAQGAKPHEDYGVEDMLGRTPCLIASVYGTESFAKRRFAFRANVVIGVLSAVAAASYERGAAPFRVSLEISAAGARAAARYAYWTEEKPAVTWVRDLSGHQPLILNADMAEFLETAPYVRHAFGLAGRKPLSELEEALVRSFFWFSDAQRDTVPVMQLVKYWSCAEGFFSKKDLAITKRVSEGVACLLIFGVGEKTPEEFKPIANKLSELYDLRSKAVHGALHDHVGPDDIALLSQWMAWMLLGIAGLIVELGYTRLEEVREQTARLAELMRVKRENNDTGV